MSVEGPGGSSGQRFTNRNGPKPLSFVVLSVLGSSVAVTAVGCVCAFIYPILKELQAERVIQEDGTEKRMLEYGNCGATVASIGIWSILVLSVIVGCICSVFSWILTYLDSYQPGRMLGTQLTLGHLRAVPGQGFLMGVAVLNGIMAMLTVIWSLT